MRYDRRWIRQVVVTALIGGGLLACDIKDHGFFAPRVSDILATLRDTDAPEFRAFSPPSTRTGPLNISRVEFEVRDLLSRNGVRPSGVNPATVQARLSLNSQLLTLTRTGDKYAADLGTTPDGAVAVQLSASDSAGNPATSSINFSLDRTPPIILFNDVPPAQWQSNAGSVPIRVTGRITDANIQTAAGTIFRAGMDDRCGTADDLIWPKGTAGGQVSENTFDYLPSVQLNGLFALDFTAYNGVQAGGQPAVGHYCIRVIATDKATDAAGVATPNSSTSFYDTRLTWNPPAPPPPTTGSIAGQVFVSQTDRLSGVTVTSGTTTTTTAADGGYRLDNIKPGPTDVTVSGLPNNVTCAPSTKSVNVTAGVQSSLDFVCTRLVAFAIIMDLSWKHFIGSSAVCAAVSTNPPQPNAPYTATFTGPPGGVQGSGQQTGTLSSAGMTFLNAAGSALIVNGINLFGTYNVTVTIGSQTASKSITVTGAAGTCP